MQIAIDVFIDMMKSQEFYVLMASLIVMGIIMEKME